MRRYARDAGHLLGRLNQLVRSDCTTRHRRREADLHRQIDDLERRIGELAEAERRAAERPQIDGDAVMAHLGVAPGPDVGAALRWLMELKRSDGVLSEADLLARLDAWWSDYRGKQRR